MKICLVGAGSFVFGPSVLHDAIIEHRLPGLHLALVDPNLELARGMAALGRRMAQSVGLEATLTAHRHWADALDGADFVVCSAAVELWRRFAIDVDIIRRCCPGHLVTEFGGVQGISYSLRQIAMIRSLAADMARRCPRSWLLCASNPLARVCQAAAELGVPTAGFCCNSMGGYGAIGRALHGWAEEFPWPRAVERYEAVMAGVNHFTFTLALVERATGRDVLAQFIAAGRRGGEWGPITTALTQRTGLWPANGDGHMRDFVAPHADSYSLEAASHGSPEERQARLDLLRDAGEGRRPWAPLLEHRAWEKPIDLVAALACGIPARFHSLNLPNGGQMPELPPGVFVETPAAADGAGPSPRRVALPRAVADFVRPAAELNDLIVRAAVTGRRDLLDAAIDLDPTITDKPAGREAVSQCLAAHADLLASA